ncbi:hypothetical protein GCWU000341_00877 [Oribacterium sp. oral taxon 078 str. F0262]|uniref:hypothetical protein n=1 Tax=Oribacterium sp. oral taxon 078 TaxID=652706 RepID=UPI0001CDECEC|nr:hypothetical protein [Oribacterium sp. oral taxon 078]EFE92358.1 hypothetical protein GCWU000341_00877 [Oribacterium sp. oral taxon 078 str. F0262]
MRHKAQKSASYRNVAKIRGNPRLKRKLHFHSEKPVKRRAGRAVREGWTFHGGIIKIDRIIFDGFPIDSISKDDSSFGQTVFSGGLPLRFLGYDAEGPGVSI